MRKCARKSVGPLRCPNVLEGSSSLIRAVLQCRGEKDSADLVEIFRGEAKPGGRGEYSASFPIKRFMF